MDVPLTNFFQKTVEFLDKLLPGDTVGADRGFTISESMVLG